MSRPTPVIELAVLRDWGATLWDPMCLTGEAGDAYDRFLLGAFGRLRAGQTQAEVIDYLVQAELELRGVRQISGAAYTAAELKTIQEVISLTVFVGFAVFVLGEKLTWNHAVGFGLIFAGAFFIFKGPLR